MRPHNLWRLKGHKKVIHNNQHQHLDQLELEQVPQTWECWAMRVDNVATMGAFGNRSCLGTKSLGQCPDCPRFGGWKDFGFLFHQKQPQHDWLGKSFLHRERERDTIKTSREENQRIDHLHANIFSLNLWSHNTDWSGCIFFHWTPWSHNTDRSGNNTCMRRVSDGWFFWLAKPQFGDSRWDVRYVGLLFWVYGFEHWWTCWLSVASFILICFSIVNCDALYFGNTCKIDVGTTCLWSYFKCV